MFVKCPKVRKQIWIPLQKWLYYFCNIALDIDCCRTLLLLLYKDSCSDMINVIVLIAKQYIYATKCLQKQLLFLKLISTISQYKHIENVIAKKHRKEHIHDKKWFLYDLV